MKKPQKAKALFAGIVESILVHALRSKDFKRWVQESMALAARQHSKAKAANDAVIRLEKDVQAQAAAVERIGNRLIEVARPALARCWVGSSSP
jgi:hypothetical protein